MVKKEKDELDTETTIADMNIEGFRWYDASRKKNRKTDERNQSLSLTPKEKRAMRRGAFLAILPFIVCVVVVFSIVYLLARLWIS